MGYLKRNLGRWIVPATLTGVVIAAVAIAPAFGGPKPKKTDTHATELRVDGDRHSGNSFDLNAPDSLLATLSGLPAGNYVVTTTFTLLRDNGGLVVFCELRAGGRSDKADAFGGGAQLQDNVGMSVTTAIPEGGSIELACADGSALVDSRESHIEITALEVSDITVLSG